MRKIVFLLALAIVGANSGLAQVSSKKKFLLPQDAEAGNLEAQYELACNLFYGRNGYEQNQEASFEWFLKAAKQGHVTSQTQIGYMYLYGKGAEKSPVEAAPWIEKAAALGNRAAQTYMAVLCRFGMGGVEQDMDKAVYWYWESAKRGYGDAQRELIKLGQADSTTFAYLHDNVPVDTTADRQQQVQPANLAKMTWIDFQPTVKDAALALAVGIRSASRIERTAVFLNGLPVDPTEPQPVNATADSLQIAEDGQRGLTVVTNDGFDMTIRKQLTLAEGTNRIRVEVTNAEGTATQEKTVTLQQRCQPQLDWIGMEELATKETFHVKAGIRSECRITQVRLLLNGESVDRPQEDTKIAEEGTRGIMAVANDGYDMMFERDVVLREGENIIQLEVTNSEGTLGFQHIVNYKK